jgi:hypothetical protein
MKIDFFMIVRYCEFSDNGEITIVGGNITKFDAHEIPWGVPEIKIASTVEMTREDGAIPHRFQAIVYQPDGEILREGAEQNIDPIVFPPETRSAQANFIMGFNNVLFSDLGLYRIAFLIDGVEERSIQFKVKLVAGAPEPNPQTPPEGDQR